MIQKFSKLLFVDQSAVYLVKVFHLYRGRGRKVPYVDEFAKRSATLPKTENWIKKKSKLKCVLITLKKKVSELVELL